ncbi:MAG: hypothetical protein HZC45_08015 [Deltaproteobacteria bacterium]|nr:hypothetical protein [Deltaproteobacteria bacterium]
MKRLLVLLVAVAVAVLLTAPSYAAELKTSGHYRVRAFGIENMTTASQSTLHTSGADDSISYVDHRFRLNLDVSEGPVMGRLQINSGNYNWGDSQTSSAWNREMFLKFPIGGASVMVGKYWAASPYTLGEIMFMDVKEALTVTIPVNNDLKLVGIIVDLNSSAAGSYDNISGIGYRLIGNYAPKGSMYSGAVGFYYNVLNDSATTANTYVEDRPMWLAGTINAAQGAWSASLTGAYKFGDKDSNASGVITSYNYKAHAFDVRASYDFAKAGGPPLSLTAILGVGSGDDNKTSTDTDLEEFTSPSPSYTHTAIFLDHGDAAEGGAQLSHAARSQAGGIGNLTMLALKAAYKLTDKTTLNITGATFSLTDETTGVASSTYQSDNLGQELDIAITHNLAKGLNLTLSGAWFIPDEKGWTLSTASTLASDDTIAEYMAKLKWDF